MQRNIIIDWQTVASLRTTSGRGQYDDDGLNKLTKIFYLA